MKIPFATCSITVVLFMIHSCKPTASSVVEGLWSIDTIYYGQHEIRGCLGVNVISFKGSRCDLPETYYCEHVRAFSDWGEWEIVGRRDSLFLDIDSKNDVFAGHHRVRFRRDMVDEVLKMEVQSDSLYMVCRKGLYNIYEHEDDIEELIH